MKIVWEENTNVEFQYLLAKATISHRGVLVEPSSAVLQTSMNMHISDHVYVITKCPERI